MYEHTIACPACCALAYQPMGQLGSRLYYSCRQCGWLFSGNRHMLTLGEQMQQIMDERARKELALWDALERANRLLAELTYSAWITGSDASSVDMRQRIRAAHEQASAALRGAKINRNPAE